jgi:hypothetical protein
MKKLFLFIICFFLISCKNEKDIVFENIEISYREGFTASGGTILIKKDGTIMNYYYGYPFNIDSSFYYIDKLEKNEINQINEQVSELMKIKFDSVYGNDGCADCTSIYISIKTKTDSINSKIFPNIKNKLTDFCSKLYHSNNINSLIKSNKFYGIKRNYKKMYFKTNIKLIPKPNFIKE